MRAKEKEIINEKLIIKEFSHYLSIRDQIRPNFGNLEVILEKFLDSEEIDKLLCEIAEKHKQQKIEVDCMRKVLERQYEILEIEKPKQILNVCIHFDAKRISIPDTNKDEIELQITIASSAHINEFLNYLQFENILEKHRIKILEEKWIKGSIIGDDDWEIRCLDQLKVQVENTISSNSLGLAYNITEELMVARTESSIIVIPTNFNYSSFPFDVNLLELEICSHLGEDLTLINFEIDMNISSNWTKSLSMPRGFKLSSYNSSVYSVIDEGFYPVSYFNSSFQINRIPTTSIWRIFLPTFVIMIFILTATGFSLINSEYIESVTTSLLPSILLASVALQLVAAQSIPPFSGRTIEDMMFVGHYLILFLSFISLLFSGQDLSLYLYFAAVCIFSIISSVYLIKSLSIIGLSRSIKRRKH